MDEVRTAIEMADKGRKEKRRLHSAGWHKCWKAGVGAGLILFLSGCTIPNVHVFGTYKCEAPIEECEKEKK